MKKINVYLQNPVRISDSLYYKNILDFPPKEISYETNIFSAGIITNKKKFFLNGFFKKTIRIILNKLNLPILNLHKVSTDFSLIHGAHCLPKTNKNWVADFEAPWQFWLSGRDTKIGRNKFLEIASKKNCKKLIAWTIEAKNELINKFPELEKKVEVLYYAMPFIPQVKKRRKDFTLLFSARYFYEKGGMHALEAMNQLTKKYPHVKAVIVSEVPIKIKDKYETNKKIKFYNLLPQKTLFEEIYPSSDIFIYPGYSDTFGFGFIEAMNFGLPIITVEGYARKEIVSQDRTGKIVLKEKRININKIGPAEMQLIEKIVNETSKIIENKKIRVQMSKNCMEEIKNGKFSINKRNDKLRSIYEEAMK